MELQRLKKKEISGHLDKDIKLPKGKSSYFCKEMENVRIIIIKSLRKESMSPSEFYIKTIRKRVTGYFTHSRYHEI